jgi:hypothetical protein
MFVRFNAVRLNLERLAISNQPVRTELQHGHVLAAVRLRSGSVSVSGKRERSESRLLCSDTVRIGLQIFVVSFGSSILI